MAKKRASKRKATTDTAVENDENHEESLDDSVENGNGDAGSSKSASNKKKKPVTTKAAEKKETSKNKTKSDEEEEDTEEDYEVEKILDVKYKKNGKREFLIRWKNYSAEHDTWEPEENLSCHELITKFLDAQEDTDTGVGNDENHDESQSSNGIAGPSKSTSSSRKKKSKTTKAAQKKETSKNKANSDDEEEDAEEDYEVEKILDVKYKKNGKREFLIRWKNYSAEHDTWEPEDNLSCHELITKFLDDQEDTDTAVGNDENHEESSASNGIAGSSKSTAAKKKKSVSTKATPTKETSKNKSKSDKEAVDPEEDYEVEKILDVNYKKNGKREFLIRWKNYSSKHDTWEPEENLSCDEIITKFLEVQEQREKQPRKDLREHPKSVTRYAAPSGGRQSRRTAGTRKNYSEEEDVDDD